MGKTRVGWIIHTFALLHATVALICRRTGVEDELLLTILTMTMALIICVKKGFRVEFSAASIITVNIIGYLLGNAGAVLFSRILGSSIFANVLSTTVTTEIIGWSIMAFSKILNQDKIVPQSISSQFLKWIILVMGSVFALRIGIILLISCRMFTPGSLMDATSRLLSNSFALITMLCMNILYVRGSDRLTARISQEWKPLVLISFMIAASLIGAALSGIGLSFEFTIDSWLEFVQTLIVTFIVQVTTYCIVYMVNYTISAGNRMQKEKEKKHVAQYRYQKLDRKSVV